MGAAAQGRPWAHTGNPRVSGRGHPATSLLRAQEKVLTWRPAPLRQLLGSDCEREAVEGAWSAGSTAEAPPPPRLQELPANGAADQSPGLLGSGGEPPAAGTLMDLCVHARDWQARGMHGLGGTRPLPPRRGGGQ